MTIIILDMGWTCQRNLRRMSPCKHHSGNSMSHNDSLLLLEWFRRGDDDSYCTSRSEEFQKKSQHQRGVFSLHQIYLHPDRGLYCVHEVGMSAYSFQWRAKDRFALKGLKRFPCL